MKLDVREARGGKTQYVKMDSPIPRERGIHSVIHLPPGGGWVEEQQHKDLNGHCGLLNCAQAVVVHVKVHTHHLVSIAGLTLLMLHLDSI